MIVLSEYDPARHAGFVYGSIAHRASPVISSDEATALLARLLPHAETKCIVAAVRDHSDDLVGWAASFRDRLLYAYVRFVARRRGIGAQLVGALRLPTPTGVLIWTWACGRIAQKHPVIYFDASALEGAREEISWKRTSSRETRTSPVSPDT